MRNGKLMTTKVAAIALSSMMVLSPLTAFASAPQSGPTTQNDGQFENNQPDPFGGDAWDIQNGTGNVADNTGALVTKYLDGVQMETITDKGDKKHTMDSYTRAGFKKTITLKNLLNDDYIPTVPDVHFDYEFAIVEVDNNTETHNVIDDKGVVKPEKVNVYSGIPGVLNPKNAKIVGEFDSKDDATGDNDGRNDVITKKIPFDITVAPFNEDGKDYNPGLYRYALIESVATMNEGERTDILKSVTDNALRGRVVDVVLSKVCPSPTDNTRAITGIIMREAILKPQDNGTYKVEWVDEENKTDGFTEDSGKNWKGEGGEIPYTLYTTYDLAIGKEITGQGLNTAEGDDNDKNKVFKFTFHIDMNDDSIAQVYHSTNASVPKDMQYKATATDNGIAFEFQLKGTERFQISGLPAGAKYTLTETDKQGFSKTYYAYDLQNLTRMKDDDRFVSQEQTEAFTALVVDQKGNNEEAKTVEIHKLGLDTAGTDHGNVQNAFVINEKLPVTITGVVMNVAPYALMVIAAAIFAGLFISKKRQEEEI